MDPLAEMMRKNSHIVTLLTIHFDLLVLMGGVLKSTMTKMAIMLKTVMVSWMEAMDIGLNQERTSVWGKAN